MLILVCVFVCTSCGWLQRQANTTPAQSEKEQDTTMAQEETPILQSPESEEIEEIEEKTEPEMKGAPDVSEIETLKPEVHTEKEENARQQANQNKQEETASNPQPVVETKPFWQSENTMQYQNLKAVATAAQQAYNDLCVKAGWISKNGKLYAYYAGNYITVDTLVENGYLADGLSAKDYEILLVDGRDVAQYVGAEVPDESKQLCVFAAHRQNDGKYLLATAADKAGSITSVDYTQLLSLYNQNHGTVGRLISTTPDYGRILNFVGLYEGKLEDYFVREIRKDDKYAVITFSNKQNTADIKQYILRNDNNYWEVVFTNLQSIYNPIYSVNRALPDLNLEILPDYNLAAWQPYVVKKDSSLINTMMQRQMIAQESDIYYQCGVKNYFYVVLTNGNRYVAALVDGVWQLIFVESDYAAVELMKQRTGENLGFIVLDD